MLYRCCASQALSADPIRTTELDSSSQQVSLKVRSRATLRLGSALHFSRARLFAFVSSLQMSAQASAPGANAAGLDEASRESLRPASVSSSSSYRQDCAHAVRRARARTMARTEAGRDQATGSSARQHEDVLAAVHGHCRTWRSLLSRTRELPDALRRQDDRRIHVQCVATACAHMTHAVVKRIESQRQGLPTA